MGSALRNLLEKAQVDRAVVAVLLTRGWQFLAGPVTFLAIAVYLTPEAQGFYFTFGSLLALQSFVELGFYIVILNVSSHEWAHLALDSDGGIVGDRDRLSRLVSLGRLIFRWYAAASAVFVVGVGAAGWAFLSRAGHPDVEWRAPWLVLVVLSALLLWAQPFGSLLEGCGQVATVNRYRLVQAVAGSVTLWLTLAAGGGLYAAATFAAAKLAVALYLLAIRYRRFFRRFFHAPAGPAMAWRTEIWPMQWRLALSGVVSYLVFSLTTPVMFHYHGPVVAGQMGMTRAIIDALLAMAMAWVYTRTPGFGRLIAKRRFGELDRLWYRSTLVSLAVLVAGAVAMWLAVWYVGVLGLGFADRLLSPWSTGLFLAAAVLQHVSGCQSAYLRAHKEEPILVLSVTSCLAIGLLVWWLGGRFGPAGAGAGYLAVMVVVVIWETAIWRRCRARWHGTAA